MRVVIAIDSFKGSISSMAAGCAIAQGVKRARPDAETIVRPLADGGEGTVDALVDGLGGTRRHVCVMNPNPTIQEKVECVWGLLPGGVCVIEMAGAAGLTLVPSEKRDPLIATTFGVGSVIQNALEEGCRRFIVGIGGSATNDAGVGMLQALGFEFLDGAKSIGLGGAALANVKTISRAGANPALKECVFRVACDVTNPLCGETGASAVFSPQKGATPDAVRTLDAALKHLSDVVGIPGNQPGDGAAGGMGYGFRTFLNAELVRGVDLILSETHLADEIAKADIVVTGEGRLDAQTVMGKAPIGVAKLAKKFGKRVIAFSGCASDDAAVVNAHGIDAYFPIPHAAMALEEAMDSTRTARNLTRAAEQVFRIIN